MTGPWLTRDRFARRWIRLSSFLAMLIVAMCVSCHPPYVATSGTMKAANGSLIKFKVLPVDDDPAGEAHDHDFVPNAPGQPVTEVGKPTPGFMITLANLGPKTIFVDTAYPYMEIAISSGPLIGRSTSHFALEFSSDSGSRMPEPLKPGQSVTVYRQLENLGATIRGKTLQCRLVLDVTGMVTSYPATPWLPSGEKASPSEYDGSKAISSEFPIVIP